MVAIQERNRKFGQNHLLSQDVVRRIGEKEMFDVFQIISRWKIETNPLMEMMDEVNSFADLVDLLVTEISEAKTAFDFLEQSFKENEKINVYLKNKFVGEIVDIIVFWVSLVQKYEAEVQPRLSIGISESALLANGQVKIIKQDVFAEMTDIARNISKRNMANQLEHFLKLTLSYLGHLNLSTQVVAATREKIAGNAMNRTFGSDEASCRTPLEEAADKYMHKHILSKRLRSLFSKFFGAEINPLEDWMKYIFRDFFNYDTFRYSGPIELEIAIYERFLEFVQNPALQVSLGMYTLKSNVGADFQQDTIGAMIGMLTLENQDDQGVLMAQGLEAVRVVIDDQEEKLHKKGKIPDPRIVNFRNNLFLQTA